MTETLAPPKLVLRAQGITKRFGPVEALRDASFELREQEIHALVGDNGAGKSTLIKVFAGTHAPDGGTLEVEGRPVHFATPREAQDAGIETVYQDLALAPHLDAADNIFLGREILYEGLGGRIGVLNRREMRRRTAASLRELDIELPSVTAPIGALSGGQRQAVAIARGAVWGRRVLILDEPVAALGVAQTAQVLDLMRRARDRGLSIILISHNMREVLDVADRVTVLRLGTTVATFDTADVSLNDLVAAITGVSNG